VVRDDSQFDGLQLVGAHKEGSHLRGDRVAVGGLRTAVRSEIGPYQIGRYLALAETRDDPSV
jgi:hypothetical protein